MPPCADVHPSVAAAAIIPLLYTPIATAATIIPPMGTIRRACRSFMASPPASDGAAALMGEASVGALRVWSWESGALEAACCSEDVESWPRCIAWPQCVGYEHLRWHWVFERVLVGPIWSMLRTRPSNGSLNAIECSPRETSTHARKWSRLDSSHPHIMHKKSDFLAWQTALSTLRGLLAGV